ncbi:DUF222 domain-containing protein [Agromyces sp. SYSU T00194]|uniref:DUF222 domain-containing protein n=1 Tax=Agromyces chitinivorans TaxID=3158560 RepID=UPI00339A83B8
MKEADGPGRERRHVPLAAGSASALEMLLAAAIVRSRTALVERTVGLAYEPGWSSGRADAPEPTPAAPRTALPVQTELPLPARPSITSRVGAAPATGQATPDSQARADASLDRLVAIEAEIAALQAARARVLADLATHADERAAVTASAAEHSLRPEQRVRELERRSLVAEVACALRMPERSTERLVDEAESLVHDLPTTLDDLATGHISYRHAQRLVDHALSLPPRARPAFEAAALPLAARLTPARFDARARRLRERMHPDTIAERARRAAEDRTVSLEPARDGMAWLHALLPAAPAAEAFARVRAAAASLSRIDGETRTETQLRADVLSDLLTGRADAPADATGCTTPDHATTGRTPPDQAPPDQAPPDHATTGRTTTDRTTTDEASSRPGTAPSTGAGRFARTRPTVFVTVPVMTLLGTTDEPGELHGVGPIDADTARELAGRAPSFIRILTHPETGARLSIGRDRYAVPSDLRAALITRDQTCRFPGCGRAAEQCEVDHVTDWARGGPTDAGNLAMLCPKHHHLRHETAWSTRTGPDPGTIQWRSPTGRHYTSDPPTQLPPAQDPPAQGPSAQGGPAQGGPAQGRPTPGRPTPGTPAQGRPTQETPAHGPRSECPRSEHRGPPDRCAPDVDPADRHPLDRCNPDRPMLERARRRRPPLADANDPPF